MISNTVHGSTSCPLWQDIRKSRRLLTLFDGAVVTDDGLDRGLWFDEEIAPGVLLLVSDGLREDRDEVSLLCLNMVGIK